MYALLSRLDAIDARLEKLDKSTSQKYRAVDDEKPTLKDFILQVQNRIEAVDTNNFDEDTANKAWVPIRFRDGFLFVYKMEETEDHFQASPEGPNDWEEKNLRQTRVYQRSLNFVWNATASKMFEKYKDEEVEERDYWFGVHYIFDRDDRETIQKLKDNIALFLKQVIIRNDGIDVPSVKNHAR